MNSAGTESLLRSGTSAQLKKIYKKIAGENKKSPAVLSDVLFYKSFCYPVEVLHPFGVIFQYTFYFSF